MDKFPCKSERRYITLMYEKINKRHYFYQIYVALIKIPVGLCLSGLDTVSLQYI